jgi:hypothetical protein
MALRPFEDPLFVARIDVVPDWFEEPGRPMPTEWGVA